MDNENQVPEPTPENKPKAPAEPENKGAVAHYKVQLQETRGELNKIMEQNQDLAKQIESMRTEKLESEKNYKELYEREKARAHEAVTRAEDVQKSYLSGLKKSAIETYAAKLGIKENYSSFLDADSPMVQIETTSTGNINVLGAQEYVEDYKLRYPEMFKSSEPPRVNTGQPQGYNGQGGEISSRDLAKLQKEDVQQYSKVMRQIQDRKLKLVRA